MGRAAAVRAATKSKTDDKKAKTNALYGKRIIMAVKQVSFWGQVIFWFLQQLLEPSANLGLGISGRI
jgi:hypothetical protein